jgi:hypothetical protein
LPGEEDDAGGPSPYALQGQPAENRLPPSPEDEDIHEEEEEEELLRSRRRRERRISQARSAVAGPAIALMVVGSLSLAFYLPQFIIFAATGRVVLDFASDPQHLRQPQMQGNEAFQRGFQVGKIIGGYLGSIAAVTWGVLVVVGGYKMKTLSSYVWATTGSITAMIPCSCCCLFGLPFGIWGLVVLNRPDVRDVIG